MTRKRPMPSTTRSRGPAAKLKSERIQGAAEKAPTASAPHGGAGLAGAVAAEIMEALAELPGWRFDEERSSFHAQLHMGQPVEMPVGGGLTVAMADEKRVEIRLREGARHWTKARLEAVRGVHRGLAHAGELVAAAQKAPGLARSAR